MNLPWDQGDGLLLWILLSPAIEVGDAKYTLRFTRWLCHTMSMSRHVTIQSFSIRLYYLPVPNFFNTESYKPLDTDAIKLSHPFEYQARSAQSLTLQLLLTLHACSVVGSSGHQDGAFNPTFL